jgi:hypothetical protein
VLPEAGPLAELTPVTVAAFSSEHRDRHDDALSDGRIAALGDVLADALTRAAAHSRCSTALNQDADPAISMSQWAAAHALEEVAACAPTVGPTADLVPRLRQILESRGITLTLVRRTSDAHAFTLAGSSFFPFWRQMSRHLRQHGNLSDAR